MVGRVKVGGGGFSHSHLTAGTWNGGQGSLLSLQIWVLGGVSLTPLMMDGVPESPWSAQADQGWGEGR